MSLISPSCHAMTSNQCILAFKFTKHYARVKFANVNSYCIDEVLLMMEFNSIQFNHFISEVDYTKIS